MLLGFRTDDMVKASSAFLVYAIYRSRDTKRGPSGVDMWAQIERFCRSSAKRAEGIDQFVQTFKRKMACGTINPRYTRTGSAANAVFVPETGEIKVFGDDARDFGMDVFEQPAEKQEEIVNCLYNNTQAVILLVRERLEREKNMMEEENDED